MNISDSNIQLNTECFICYGSAQEVLKDTQQSIYLPFNQQVAELKRKIERTRETLQNAQQQKDRSIGTLPSRHSTSKKISNKYLSELKRQIESDENTLQNLRNTRSSIVNGTQITRQFVGHIHQEQSGIKHPHLTCLPCHTEQGTANNAAQKYCYTCDVDSFEPKMFTVTWQLKATQSDDPEMIEAELIVIIEGPIPRTLLQKIKEDLAKMKRVAEKALKDPKAQLAIGIGLGTAGYIMDDTDFMRLGAGLVSAEVGRGIAQIKLKNEILDTALYGVALGVEGAGSIAEGFYLYKWRNKIQDRIHLSLLSMTFGDNADPISSSPFWVKSRAPLGKILGPIENSLLEHSFISITAGAKKGVEVGGLLIEATGDILEDIGFALKAKAHKSGNPVLMMGGQIFHEAGAYVHRTGELYPETFYSGINQAYEGARDGAVGAFNRGVGLFNRARQGIRGLFNVFQPARPAVEVIDA